MPRRARLRYAGVPLHIVQRGNNRIACFFAEQDYRCYLRHLEELARRFECGVHAYVLMTNHVHLLITPSETASASLLMKHLGSALCSDTSTGSTGAAERKAVSRPAWCSVKAIYSYASAASN